MKSREFLGRNIARIKFGKEYIAIISFMITAISTMSIFLNLSIPLFLIILVISLFFGWFLGYIFEKKGILSAERETLNLVNLRVQKKIWRALMEDVISPIIKETIKDAYKELGRELGKELEEIRD